MFEFTKQVAITVLLCMSQAFPEVPEPNSREYTESAVQRQKSME